MPAFNIYLHEACFESTCILLKLGVFFSISPPPHFFSKIIHNHYLYSFLLRFLISISPPHPFNLLPTRLQLISINVNIHCILVYIIVYNEIPCSEMRTKSKPGQAVKYIFLLIWFYNKSSLGNIAYLSTLKEFWNIYQIYIVNI